jgi:arylsulfatase A-like enzyme
MTVAQVERVPRSGTSPSALSARGALGLAMGFGLAGGYLDLMIMLVKKILDPKRYYYWHEGRFFPWAVPTASLALLVLPGLVIAAANRLRPGLVPGRAAAWLLAALALGGGLLKLPLFGWASLLLAAGVGRWISRAVVALVARLGRPGRFALWEILVSPLGVLVALSSGRQAVEEWRALARLPAPPRGASNVLLIVLDTVRAESLSLYGYARDTAPNLTRWAKKGVRFDCAIAPASWTFPSHSSFFTGRWPHQLNPEWQSLVLDAPYPTLAESLAARGYQTAGFVANTSYCSYESGLNRGFAHFEDYPLTFRYWLGSTIPGRWFVRRFLGSRDFYSLKWTGHQSRDAAGINQAFLAWLDHSKQGERPFFVFLNYLDAHDPFVPPPGQTTYSGLRPDAERDYRLLLNYWDMDKRGFSACDQALVRDAYDDCITALDRQVGTLLDELERRGILRDTTVIITSDHGEEFGEHNLFGHGISLYRPEVHVPLVIISPEAPAGAVVAAPVSLRDLPATVVDMVGLSAVAPFPGRSLAAHWRAGGVRPLASRRLTSPALSENANPPALHPRHGFGPTQQSYAMGLVTEDRHYIRDGEGVDELYDWQRDPSESRDLAGLADEHDRVRQSRKALLQILTEEPAHPRGEGYLVKPYREWLEILVHGRPHAAGP